MYVFGDFGGFFGVFWEELSFVFVFLILRYSDDYLYVKKPTQRNVFKIFVANCQEKNL